MTWWDSGMINFSVKRKLYLSGKMAGLPDHGKAYFCSESERLRGMGYDIVNPAENPSQDSWENYMKADLIQMLGCDGVAVLDNWRDSPGAKIEVELAQRLKIPVVNSSDLTPVSETVLEEAQRLVQGPRQGTYGHPSEDYRCVSGMFSSWLTKKYGQTVELTAADALMFMVIVKLSREANLPKRDNRVDASGYLLCLDMVEHETESGGVS